MTFLHMKKTPSSHVAPVGPGDISVPVEKTPPSPPYMVPGVVQQPANIFQVNSHASQEEKPNMPRNSDVSRPDSGRPNPFETDVEAMISHQTSVGAETARIFGDCRINDNDSRVWPGQKHWKKKAKEAKIKRSRTCLSRLSKRNRMIAKILIGVLIIGIAVGIGVGISKPLGAGIWKPHKA